MSSFEHPLERLVSDPHEIEVAVMGYTPEFVQTQEELFRLGILTEEIQRFSRQSMGGWSHLLVRPWDDERVRLTFNYEEPSPVSISNRQVCVRDYMVNLSSTAIAIQSGIIVEEPDQGYVTTRQSPPLIIAAFETSVKSGAEHEAKFVDPRIYRTANQLFSAQVYEMLTSDLQAFTKQDQVKIEYIRTDTER